METTPTDLTENKQTHNQNGKKKTPEKNYNEDEMLRGQIISGNCY